MSCRQPYIPVFQSDCSLQLQSNNVCNDSIGFLSHSHHAGVDLGIEGG